MISGKVEMLPKFRDSGCSSVLKTQATGDLNLQNDIGLKENHTWRLDLSCPGPSVRLFKKLISLKSITEASHDLIRHF